MPSPTSTKSNGLTSKLPEVASAAGEKLQHAGQHFMKEPALDLLVQLRDYAQRKPDVAAMWCFGLGLVVGWKLRR